VGQGFRTNAEGLRQLAGILKDDGIRTEPVDLPYFRGPDACLHLMSLISLVDEDLAVIYPRLLPVPFWRSLKEARFDFIEVPDSEFERMAPNVLAVGPRDCIMLEGNPITRQRLEDAGCRVRTYRGDEISLKAEGGATCLTRPILRAR
jgi:N-dimethylarginine dimethylaminohydrolase